MLKEFYSHTFNPHGIIASFPMDLCGKTSLIKFKVVDAPLDHNLLLGKSWFYAMTYVASSIFWVLLFRHEGKVVTIDHWHIACLIIDLIVECMFHSLVITQVPTIVLVWACSRIHH
jgi:hypothetical protein